MNNQVFLEFPRIAEDRDETVLVGLCEVVPGHVQLALGAHSQGRGAQSALELVEHRGVVDATAMNDDSEDSVHQCLCDVEYILVGTESKAARVRQLTVHDWLQHGDAKVDCVDRASGVLQVRFAQGARVCEEKRVVLF